MPALVGRAASWSRTFDGSGFDPSRRDRRRSAGAPQPGRRLGRCAGSSQQPRGDCARVRGADAGATRRRGRPPSIATARWRGCARRAPTTAPTRSRRSARRRSGRPAWSRSRSARSRTRATTPCRHGRALLHIRGRGNVWWVRLLGRLYPEQKAKAFDTDLDLTGWPWTRDTSSWVEPTAWAMLALRALGDDLSRHAVDGRLELAEAMMLDRACPDGGWNHGNGRVLGQDLRPYPDTTALALLAMRPRHPSPETTAGLADAPAAAGVEPLGALGRAGGAVLPGLRDGRDRYGGAPRRAAGA